MKSTQLIPENYFNIWYDLFKNSGGRFLANPCLGKQVYVYYEFEDIQKPNAFEACEKYYELAQEFNISLTQLALAFVNTRPFLTSNIIGATTLAQLKENIDSLEFDFSEELEKRINEIHEVIPNPAP